MNLDDLNIEIKEIKKPNILTKKGIGIFGIKKVEEDEL